MVWFESCSRREHSVGSRNGDARTLQKLAVWLGGGSWSSGSSLSTPRPLGLAARLIFTISFWSTVSGCCRRCVCWRSEADPRNPSRAAVIAVAGALYRFDTYLVAFNPGPGWHYFPTVPEILISVGVISIELALYVALVKRFPILGGMSYAE